MVECLEEISEVEYRTIRKDKIEEIKGLNLHKAWGDKIRYYKIGDFAFYEITKYTRRKEDWFRYGKKPI